jgi:hypothetical protein
MESGIEQFDLGIKALIGLLEEFREGSLVNKQHEKQALKRHLSKLSQKWDQRFPGFPRQRCFYASLWGVIRRGVRDKYLKSVIVTLLEDEKKPSANNPIVNPACVIGRHARDLARRLKHYRIIATDIDPAPNWFYGHIRRRRPVNFEFRQDNIFSPQLNVAPAAVVFFGACGSISDGAIDYAINSKSPYLICRTCCHDNIGGNTRIVKRPTALNRAFRLKNFIYSKVRTLKEEFYFSDKYSQDQYPRSQAAGNLSHPNEFMEISRNSVDSDICRAIIDLDRYLRLIENGYDTWYKGELLIGRKRNVPPNRK